MDLRTGIADDSSGGYLGVRFREDILRGVRLFAIVFAAVLLCVAAYRAFRPAADAQGAPADPPIEAAKPSPEPSPDAAPSSEATHPLVVPEPPPAAGAPVAAKEAKRVVRPRDPGVPPPPPITSAVHARHAAPAGREFEASDAVALPAPPVEESAEPKPLTPKQAVGYKSLIEANPNRPVAAEPTPAPDEASEKPVRGNRFFKAVGKIFHPGKKDTPPTTLQPQQ
jgi:hypothetical protein